MPSESKKYEAVGQVVLDGFMSGLHAVINCGKCHTCGGELRQVLDGEEWCPVCQTYRRYIKHGWVAGDDSPCRQEATDAES